MHLDEKYNIAIRSGMHCVHSWFNSRGIEGTARASAYLYNNESDIRKFTDAIEETFRGKPTGNKVLGFACSFCPYKLPCWGSKLQLLPQQQSKGKNPKWVWYTEVKNPKKDETMEAGGE